MADRKRSHFVWEQAGIAGGTLGATVLAALFFAPAAPFCFSLGLSALIWHGQRRDRARLFQTARRVGEVETMAHRTQRETSILRESLDTLSTRTTGQPLTKPVLAVDKEPSKEGAVRYEALIKNIASTTSARTLSTKPATGATLSDTVVRELLTLAIENDRVELFAQPVVRLPSRRAAYYELFARLRAGTGLHVGAERYLDLAQKENLLPSLDNVLLLHTLNILREQDAMGTHPCEGYFLNLSATTLADAKFINDLLAFVEHHPALAQRLIFEFAAPQIKMIPPRAHKLFSGLSRLGCRFSLDHVTANNYMPEFLGLLPLSFIKMDAQSVIREITRPTGVTRIRTMKKQILKADVALVMDRIEDHQNLLAILDFDIGFGQGNLFATAQPLSHLKIGRQARNTA